MFYTYILKSEKDNRRYIGFTSDIKVWLEFHNSGLNSSTKNRRPLKLICYKLFETRKEAMRCEKYLKKLKGGKQLDIEIAQMENSPL